MVSYRRGERKVDFLTHKMEHRVESSPRAGLQVLLKVKHDPVSTPTARDPSARAMRAAWTPTLPRPMTATVSPGGRKAGL
jgi:hypothetical protein